VDDDANLTGNSDLNQVSIAPVFILETTGSLDGLTIRFNPSYVYDQESKEHNLNHDFSLDAYRNCTRKLRVDFNENYIYSNDPQLLPAQNSGDYNPGRRSYWTNDLGIGVAYAYNTASSFESGYTYQMLRNDDTGIGGYENYNRHSADISLQHRINRTWNFGLSANYTKGLFDQPDHEEDAPADISDDLSEYQGEIQVNWVQSRHNAPFISYEYIGTDYDDVSRLDSTIHNFTLGTEYQYSRHIIFTIGGGPSLEKTDSFEGNWNYNAHGGIDYVIAEHTSMALSGEKGFNQNNFSVNSRDQGLTKFWEWQLNLNHSITPNLIVTAFSSYRYEQQDDITYDLPDNPTNDETISASDWENFREENMYNRKIYVAGGTLGYAFLRWYRAELQYSYRRQNSELINDSYDEHRLFLTISFQKELLRW